MTNFLNFKEKNLISCVWLALNRAGCCRRTVMKMKRLLKTLNTLLAILDAGVCACVSPFH